jgi:hypothetical protein
MFFQSSKNWLNGKNVRRTWLREQPRRTKKGCMPSYYCPRGFVSKMVSSPKSKTTWKEELDRVAIGGHEEEKYYEGEVYQEQETSKSCTYFPYKW